MLDEENSKNEYGVTKEYNQLNRNKLWDSDSGKKNYKKKVFQNKKTYRDPLTGQELHLSQKASQNKYHMKNKNGENISSAWAGHAPETDHIVSLKEIHNRTKNNPFFTDHDLKEAANQDYNYRVTSKKFNASKGEKSDIKIALAKNNSLTLKGRQRIVREKLNAEMHLNTRIAMQTASNMGNEFLHGARDSLSDSLVPLTMEAARHIVHVMKGEEDISEAVKSTGGIAGEAALVGGGKKIAADVLSSALGKGNALSKFMVSKELNQLIAVGLIVKESSLQYLNGQIDGADFVKQIQEQGLVLLAGTAAREVGLIIGGLLFPGVGVVAGAVAGEILGTVVTTVVCSAVVDVINTIKHLNDYKLKENQIKRIEAAALNEMSMQRENLKAAVEREYSFWDAEIQAGFDRIIGSACEQTCDFNGIAQGLNKILNLFGKEVRFASIKEYESQLDKPLVLNLGGS